MLPEEKKTKLIQVWVDENTKKYAENRAKTLKGNIADYIRKLIDDDFDRVTEA